MKIALILLSLLLQACSSSGDFTVVDGSVPPDAFERGIDTDPTIMLEHQSEAQELTFTRFEEIYVGLSLDGLDPTVYWTSTPCPEVPTKTAVVYTDECYNGLTFSCDEIYVAYRGTVGDSAFVHELGHCMRLFLGIGGDGEHLDTEWWRIMEKVILPDIQDLGW